MRKKEGTTFLFDSNIRQKRQVRLGFVMLCEAMGVVVTCFTFHLLVHNSRFRCLFSPPGVEDRVREDNSCNGNYSYTVHCQLICNYSV